MAVDAGRVEQAAVMGALARIVDQFDRKIARQQHGVDQVADDGVELAEAGSGIVVAVGRIA